MIISKTPFRMSFVGGGSDLPVFYQEEEGAVVSTTIDKYMYICVNQKFDGRIRVSYTKTEDVEFVSQVEHPLVREALDVVGIQGGIEITSMADIPSKGSGLGSSSSYTVGLLNALYAYRNKFTSKEVLAKQSCEIEINRCGEPIGKQDQYAAAYGGLNLIRFQPNGSTFVDPIICSPEIYSKLEESVLVFFTGRTRSASKILAKQSVEMIGKKQKILTRRMVQISHEMKRQLESGSLDSFGGLLDENWKLKIQLTSGISDYQIDDWYATGLANGALGGKLLGAGNGGFLMFFAPLNRHQHIIRALSNLMPVKFPFERAGSQIVYFNQPFNR